MNYREITALLREAESRDNLAASLKGGKAAKEFRKEREAMEKAAGGARKLAEAEKVLAGANAEGHKIVAKAMAAASAHRINADGDIKAMKAELAERRQDLDERHARLNDMKAGLDATATALKNDLIDLKARAKAADERAVSFDRREANVATREANAERREAEIKRFDAWRATAPA